MAFQIYPSEILLQIFVSLDNVKDLACVSRTCWDLHSQVEAKLYSKFTENNPKDLPLLLRTVIENPRFGQYIKTVKFCESDVEKQESLRCAWRLKNRRQWTSVTSLRARLEEYHTLCQPLMRANDSTHVYSYFEMDAEDNLERLDDMYNWDHLVSTLLLYAHSLESITFLWNDYSFPMNTLAFLENAGMLQRIQAKESGKISPFSLPRLKEVTIAPRRPVGQRLGMRVLLPAIKIDSLVSLSCDSITQTEFLDNLYDPILIQELNLTSCGLPALYVDKILRSCTNLKRFHLGYSYHTRHSNLRPSTLFRSLLHVADSLESLTILDDDNAFDQPQGRSDHGILPCLKGFTKLQSLEIRSQLIFTKQVLHSTAYNKLDGVSSNGLTRDFSFSDLPASLERLALRDATEDIIKHFVWIDLNAIPKLKTLRVAFAEFEVPLTTEGEADVTGWPVICSAYRSNGIEISFNNHQYGGDEEWFTY